MLDKLQFALPYSEFRLELDRKIWCVSHRVNTRIPEPQKRQTKVRRTTSRDSDKTGWWSAEAESHLS